MTKQDILDKLQELENYSIQQTNHSELSSVMNTFENSLNAFLNNIPNSCKEQLKELPVKFCMDYFRRNTAYSDDSKFGLSLPTNYPLGYNNLMDLFGGLQFDGILNVSNDDFANAWTFYQQDPVTLETPDPTNTYITQWSTQINNLSANVSGNLQTLLNFYDDAGNWNEISMFENRGQLLYTVEKEKFVNDLFIIKKWLDVINLFNLDAYIPISLR